MSLGSQIRRYRDAQGLTLEQLAERSDVDIGTISALEMRHSQRSKFAAQIARGLGLTVEQLLDEQTDYLVDTRRAPERLPSHQPAALREPAAAYSAWPFAQISPSEYARLDDAQRAQVEGFAMGLLMSGKRQAAGNS